MPTSTKICNRAVTILCGVETAYTIQGLGDALFFNICGSVHHAL